MKRKWEPEITVELPLAVKLIREQFPQINTKYAESLGIGWDNTAFLIDKKYVFRFPRREIAAPLIEIEYCTLPKIARLLPLQIPNPKWLGKPTDQYPWFFSGYQIIHGLTACRVMLNEDERIDMIEPIAKFLLSLHSIPVSEVKSCQLGGDTIGRLNVNKLNTEIEKNLNELKTLGFLKNARNINDIVFINGKPNQDTIVHGDFYVRHLLIDERRKLTGVIDWGDIHIGDRAVDLSIVHSFFPVYAHQKFRDIYGNVSEDTWKLARLRALHHSAILAVFGHHTNDKNIMNEALRSIKLILYS